MLSTILLGSAIFLAAYLLNIFFITVLYHRGIAHGAVELNSLSVKAVRHLGIWVTGIDPKAWACMHRLHHTHSDTKLDPHSPVHLGIFGVARGQLKSYERVLIKLIKRDPTLAAIARDIPFDVHALNRKKLWYIPYLLHFTIGVALSVATNPWIGIAYFLGMMSHPFQGWLVNAFAHNNGYRNYGIADHSRNNLWVSFFVFGEGYQNNHHAFPKSANFGRRAFEIDMGYWMCLLSEKVGFLKIERATLNREAIPKRSAEILAA